MYDPQLMLQLYLENALIIAVCLAVAEVLLPRA